MDRLNIFFFPLIEGRVHIQVRVVGLKRGHVIAHYEENLRILRCFILSLQWILPQLSHPKHFLSLLNLMALTVYTRTSQTFHTVVLRENTIDILSAFESILMRLLIAGSNELGHWLPPNPTWGHRGRGESRSWHTCNPFKTHLIESSGLCHWF